MHHYGAFRLPSFCIGRRLSTLVSCGTTRVMRTNIHNAQSCCEWLASADVNRCTSMKSEFTIIYITRVVPQKTSVDRRRPMQNDGSLTSSLCIGRRWTLTDAQRCQVLSLWHRSAMKGVIEQCRKTSADVQRWQYERTISRHLYWNDVTLMVYSDFIAAHRSTNICVRNAGGHVQKAVSANVGWCKAIEVWMHSTTIFRFQGPPVWHENYRSTP